MFNIAVCCRYLKAIDDVDVELSVSTKGLDVSALSLLVFKLPLIH